jgi:phage terminase large subunit GpA-like protein
MDMDYEGAAEIERAWREGLTPDPLLTVSEWSDRHRMLSSKASAEPGRWRTSRTPYLKAIMDCLSPTSPVERVVFMKAAQLGATEMGSNWIGYVIHHAPGPMMAVWPTVEMAKRNSKQRIDPLIEESSALAELIAPARSRDSGNTILAKEFRGGVLVMTGANSAVGLRSMPVRYLFLDEVDGYPLDVEGEGDAISLAEARTRTFARRKIFIVSTPTISGASAIEREYEASDQRRYFVPCPHCSHRQWLRFEQLRWDKGQPETAAYICESCDTAIAEHHKTWMLEHGEWRAMITDGAGKTAGFHLSSLYSPVGWRLPLPGKPPSARNQDQQPPSRPSRTPSWVIPGSRKAKRRTGNGWSSAERTTASVACRKAVCCWSARPMYRRIASRHRFGPSGAARSRGSSSIAC